MSKKLSNARPYAKALCEIAKVKDNYLEWVTLLHYLAILIQDHQIVRLLHNPLYSTTQIAELLYECSEQVCPTGGKAFISLLAQKNRLESIPFIFDLFEKARLKAENKVAVEVITAHSLTEREKEQILVQLATKLSGILQITYRVDETLMGGFIARTGDRVMDGSLRTLLSQLQESLSVHF